MNSILYEMLDGVKRWCKDNEAFVEAFVGAAAATARRGWDRGGERSTTIQEAWGEGAVFRDGNRPGGKEEAAIDEPKPKKVKEKERDVRVSVGKLPRHLGDSLGVERPKRTGPSEGPRAPSPTHGVCEVDGCSDRGVHVFPGGDLLCAAHYLERAAESSSAPNSNGDDYGAHRKAAVHEKLRKSGLDNLPGVPNAFNAFRHEHKRPPGHCPAPERTKRPTEEDGYPICCRCGYELAAHINNGLGHEFEPRDSAVAAAHKTDDRFETHQKLTALGKVSGCKSASARSQLVRDQVRLLDELSVTGLQRMVQFLKPSTLMFISLSQRLKGMVSDQEDDAAILRHTIICMFNGEADIPELEPWWPSAWFPLRAIEEELNGKISEGTMFTKNQIELALGMRFPSVGDRLTNFRPGSWKNTLLRYTRAQKLVAVRRGYYQNPNTR